MILVLRVGDGMDWVVIGDEKQAARAVNFIESVLD